MEWKSPRAVMHPACATSCDQRCGPGSALGVQMGDVGVDAWHMGVGAGAGRKGCLLVKIILASTLLGREAWK
jgi:hypothetical protein